MARIWTNGSGLALNATDLNAMEGDISAGKTIRWTPNTFYGAGTAVLNPSGVTATSIADHTSGSTYDPTLWRTPQTGIAAALAIVFGG